MTLLPSVIGVKSSSLGADDSIVLNYQLRSFVWQEIAQCFNKRLNQEQHDTFYQIQYFCK